jgi:hypothetical protein
LKLKYQKIVSIVLLAVLTLHLTLTIVDCIGDYLQYQSPLIPASVVKELVMPRIRISILTFTGVCIGLILHLKKKPMGAIVVNLTTLLAQVILDEVKLA